jgi:molecular chaperone DnaJ
VAAQREWFEKDYYQVLGVSKTASDKEITKAYRKLAKQYHPDANPGDAKAEEMFKNVSTAYDVLGDAAKRKEYDEVRSMAASGMGGFGGGNPFGGGAQGGANFNFEDLGDLFGGLFGRGGRRGGGGAGPQRGQDLQTTLNLSFLDAVNGVETSVNVVSDASCQTCAGTGAEPGTMPVPCPTCSGAGVVADNQGVFSFSRPCPTCHGSGRKIEKPCITCKGSGVQRRSRQVKVRIPAGVKDQQNIRIKGRGGAGRNGGPAGDLFVTVNVSRHELFGRSGNDLTITVPVTFPELALGTNLPVPTLIGPVTVKVPAGTKSGRVLRVKGRGAPVKNGSGDLLVTVELAEPKNLSKEEKKAVEALAEVMHGESVRRHLAEFSKSTDAR